MSGAVALEVEFLGGVSYSSAPFDRAHSEWPPHPDRVFQALVAACGRFDEPRADEIAALEWLERRDPATLSICASAAAPRDVVTVFVPPNDARVTSSQAAEGLRVLPEYRRNRQPRTFPAAIPERSVVRYFWTDAGGVAAHAGALSRLAREVTYVGHSASLVRMAFLPDAQPGNNDETWLGASGHTTLRVPYAGRCAELRARYAAGRPSSASTVTITRRREASEPQRAGAFRSGGAIVLTHADGFRPSLDAFPLVAKRLRDALLASARDHGLPIPELISGHHADGAPSHQDHLAIVPLANVGWTYSDGALLGLALLWPSVVEPAARFAALGVLRAFLEGGGGTIPLLHFGRSGSWRLRIDDGQLLASMSMGRYSRPSKAWASVLPVVLDRHPKHRSGADAASVIAMMLTRAGIPAESISTAHLDILATSHVRGAPSIHAVRAALPSDSPYRGRPMTHLRLTFSEPLRGPILLGAGRHRGLGLLLPIDGGDA
jgi:CRISPR-associated protein Csb2